MRKKQYFSPPPVAGYADPMQSLPHFSGDMDERLGVAICERFPGELRRRILDCSKLFCLYAGRTRDELLSAQDVRPFQWSLHDESELWLLQSSVEAGEPYQEKFIWQPPAEPIPGSLRFQGMINRCHGQVFRVGERLICHCRDALVRLPWAA